MNILRTATLVAIFIKCVTASTGSIPSQDDLIEAASSLESMCSPNDLLKLIDKVEKQEDQEKAIKKGVVNLFIDERTDCIEPLLTALEGNESFKHLKDIAIKAAIKGGSYYGNKSIVDRFHDHPAVTSEDYAQGLIYSGEESTQDPVFNFLLGEADQGDLNAVKMHNQHEHKSGEFKKKIEDALLIAKPGGTRLTLPFQRAELVMKTFRKNPRMGIHTEISQLIGYYLADESILEPRSMLVDTVTEILESDDSGIRMATVISELVISYFVEELTTESIIAPVKQAISIKGAQPDGSADESA